MINFQNYPAPEKTCLNCVHHTYEENQEKVAEASLPYVLVCFMRRKLIQQPGQAKDCLNYYTGAND